MSADQIKLIFDQNAILIIFAWGLICKYVPGLAKIPNTVIPYVGAAGYILTKLGGPALAHAGGFDAGSVAPDLIGVLIGGFTNAVWARQLYEGFGRALLEGIFHRKKAVAA